MSAWLEECTTHAAVLARWYEPLYVGDGEVSFEQKLRNAIGAVTDAWLGTHGQSAHETTLICTANPGGLECNRMVPRARLWKGPLRVLLEQSKYGVLGRTLRCGPDGKLAPAWSDVALSNTGGNHRVEEDGYLTIECQGDVLLRQDESGEVTNGDVTFLPGDVLEFPLFLLLAAAGVPTCQGASFNPLGSPYLGTSVRDASGASPGTVRLHDNMIGMRFQLLFNLARGAFSSFYPTFAGPGEEPPPTPGGPVPPVHSPPTADYGRAPRRAQFLPNTAGMSPDERRAAIVRANKRFARAREEYQAAVAQHRQNAANYRVKYRREIQAYNAAVALARRNEPEEVREAARERRRDYNHLAYHETICGMTVYARGMIYGGTLTNTAPVAYGVPYRYFDMNWGNDGRILPSWKGLASLPYTAESLRLTFGWTCTPSSIALTHYMTHATRLKLGGSVRSQYDCDVSIYTELVGAGEPRIGAARRERFLTFWDEFPVTDGALERFVGNAQAVRDAFLLRNTDVIMGDDRVPARTRGILRRLGRGKVEPVLLSMSHVRDYFLRDFQSSLTVVSLTGHEYMLLWVWPHDYLLREAAVTGDGTPGPWAEVSRIPSAAPSAPAATVSDEYLRAAYGIPGTPATVLVPPPANESDAEAEADDDASNGTDGPRNQEATFERLPSRVNDDPGGTTLEREELWNWSMNRPLEATTAPLVGPPVAGFLACYDPFTGIAFDFGQEAEPYIFEARGGRTPCPLGAVPGMPNVHGVTVLTAIPFRWERIEEMWVKLEGADFYMPSSGRGESTRDQRTQAFTHFDMDALRRLHATAIAYEPIYTHARGGDRLHAFTGHAIPRPPRAPRRHGEPPPPPPPDPPRRKEVADAWISDRAIPFATFLETRDDDQYMTRGHVDTVHGETATMLHDLRDDIDKVQASVTSLLGRIPSLDQIYAKQRQIENAWLKLVGPG